MSKFSPTAAISFGWQTFKKNIGFSIGYLVILFLPQLIFSMVFGGFTTVQPDSFEEVFTATAILSNLVLWLVVVLVSLGLTKAMINMVDSGKGNLSDVLIPFKEPKILLNFFLANLVLMLLYAIAIPAVGILIVFTFGLGLLLVVPIVIYLSIRLQFFSYFIIDKTSGPIQAFKQSWAATAGNFWNIFLFGLLSVLVVIAGLIALIVGVLVAIPVVVIAQAWVYRQLSSNIGQTASTPTMPATETPPAVEAAPQTQG